MVKFYYGYIFRLDLKILIYFKIKGFVNFKGGIVISFWGLDWNSGSYLWRFLISGLVSLFKVNL